VIRYYWDWTCDICGEEYPTQATKFYRPRAAVEQPNPIPGFGWRNVDEALICPKHEVTIVDKEEEE